MRKPWLVFLSTAVLLALPVLGVEGAPAARPPAQAPYATPTPGPDGRILYTVKAGDSCTSIAAANSVALETLRTINNLDVNCGLREGQTLLLGMGGPAAASPTPGPSPTPTPATPTATPINGGMAQVCVLVYEDVNGDALRQETEGALAGAALSLTSIDGSYSQTQVTAINPDPEAYPGMCFKDVPMGRYNISAAPPSGYNPTIQMASELTVTAGDTAYVDYGAQLQGTGGGTSGRQGPSPLLGVFGAVFLLAGIGLAIYTWRIMKKK